MVDCLLSRLALLRTFTGDLASSQQTACIIPIPANTSLITLLLYIWRHHRRLESRKGHCHPRIPRDLAFVTSKGRVACRLVRHHTMEEHYATQIASSSRWRNTSQVAFALSIALHPRLFLTQRRRGSKQVLLKSGASLSPSRRTYLVPPPIKEVGKIWKTPQLVRMSWMPDFYLLVMLLKEDNRGPDHKERQLTTLRKHTKVDSQTQSSRRKWTGKS